MLKIDWTKPITAVERAHAEQWEMFDQIEANDREFAGKEAEPAQDRAERMEALRGQIASATNELARLEQEQIDEDNTNRALAGDPATGNVIRDNTAVDGQTPEGAPEPPATYEGWNADKLKAEIRERNKDRGEAGLEPLSTSGSKAELTERLLADDREIAESQDQ